MRIDVVTIFPDYLAALSVSLIGKAREHGLIDVAVHDLRRWTHDVHHSVDDAPYGGGPGMLMRPQPWYDALAEIAPPGTVVPRLVVPTPAGATFDQAAAHRLAAEPWLVFACGRYEGIDDRVLREAAEWMPVEELSLGDYVLAGGEGATLVMIEAVARLVPGVLGNAESAVDDSFAGGLLEGPAYTRPEVWRGRSVPAVLLSGDHARIARWHRDQALRRTAARRPELIVSLADTLDVRDRTTLSEAGFRFPDRM